MARAHPKHDAVANPVGQESVASDTFWHAISSWVGVSPESEETIHTHTVEVPVTLNRRHWGTVEFSFLGDRSSFLGGITNHSLFPLICYFAVAGLLAYTSVVARIMGVFSKTQVVPDRVRQALDTLAEGLLVLDDRGRIVLANEAFLKCTNGDRDELTGASVDSLRWMKDGSSDEDAESDDIQRPWAQSIFQSETTTGSILRYELPDEEVRIFSVNSAPIGGEGDRHGALVTFRDVTHIEAHRAEQEKMLAMLRSSRDEIHRKNRELELLATRDSLTNCLNRRAFFERFETLWNTAKQDGKPLSCLMFDNDHFKSVNDTYGHHIGDEVLRQVAKVIRNNHEENHLVCRYGGEEFCVVLPHCDLEVAKEEAEKTRRDIMAIRLDDPAELRLTASIGVSELVFEAADPQGLINQADACLYVAKEKGRNRVVAYEPGLEDQDHGGGEESREHKREESAAHDMLPVPFQAVTALLGALSYRDSDTAEHSCRVADICVRMADDMLDQRQIHVLEVAGLLHDIGKIGVPDHVLLKPGKLTNEEWELMGQHDAIGVDIIEGTFNSKELAEIIHCHHAFFAG
ncbi:MAG: diguanylate cyclase, partial [Planctomycetota bacterium]